MPPYLQRTGPDEMVVLWETATGEESRVDYGLTEALGTVATGSVDAEGIGLLHRVVLPDLLPDTAYWYVAQTGGLRSAPQRFRTPPPAGAPLRLLAVSDVQRDDAYPDKWEEVVTQGVVPEVTQGGTLPMDEALGLVLVAGDLVDQGWLYTDWHEDFFAGAAPLMGQVPLLPVPGNHEGNSPLFWRYFELPETGTVGFEEHWWWLDHGNVRILGLDSNGAYAGAEQLSWLEQILSQTCEDPTIDLVLAQLHHPAKSELWPDGESDFSTEVVARLEAFSTACGRPSVHLFGHTHGYSRGQSRDHRHLWVNVATGGGAIDRWGSSAQVDYAEMSVSQAEYGFVLLDVDDQGFGIRRMSLGTPEDPHGAELSDEVEIRFVQEAPGRPTLEVDTAEGLSLVGSPFEPASTGQLGARQLQVAADCTDWTTPVVDDWAQHENWFYEEDRMAGVDLGRLDLAPLPAGDWCARLRYRDRGLNWSEWSEPVPFTWAG